MIDVIQKCISSNDTKQGRAVVYCDRLGNTKVKDRPNTYEYAMSIIYNRLDAKY